MITDIVDDRTNLEKFWNFFKPHPISFGDLTVNRVLLVAWVFINLDAINNLSGAWASPKSAYSVNLTLMLLTTLQTAYTAVSTLCTNPARYQNTEELGRAIEEQTGALVNSSNFVSTLCSLEGIDHTLKHARRRDYHNIKDHQYRADIWAAGILNTICCHPKLTAGIVLLLTTAAISLLITGYLDVGIFQPITAVYFVQQFFFTKLHTQIESNHTKIKLCKDNIQSSRALCQQIAYDLHDAGINPLALDAINPEVAAAAATARRTH